MTHWLDRLALRAAAGSPETNVVPSADPPVMLPGAALSRRDLVEFGAVETAEHLPLALSSILVSPIDGPFSRRAGLRALGLATGLLLAAPLRNLGPSNAGAASAADCLPDCLAAAEVEYRLGSIHCNSGIPDPGDLLGLPFNNLFCQAVEYQRLITARRRCLREGCGRKQPPPPAAPPPRRDAPPPPPGGCGLIGMTSCGATCCPAGYLCSGSTCIPPPSTPPPVDQCNPPCPPGKKCQNGQCVDVSSDCGTCPPGAKCCSGCSFGAYCAAADFTCRC